jgi:hypothetical protein
MIQSATASRSPAPPDRAADTRRSEGNGSFQQSLAAFLDAGTDNAEPPVAATPGNDDPAADGNPLPDAPAPTPLAWLAPLTPIAPATVPVGDTPRPATPAVAPAMTPVMAPVVVAAVVAPTLVLAAAPALAGPTPVATPRVAAPRGEAATGTPVIEMADTSVAGSPPAAPSPVASALPTAPDPARAAAAPAAEVFGAAIRAAVGKDDDAAPRRESVDSGPLPVGAVGLEPQRHAVAAAGYVQQAPLDTRQDNFPDQMIDRIERLRDDANANDTRIRLIPDALGQIDVTMRRDGDAVHVHFAAEQSATRALLENARPQLADIAASRGLNLGQTSVGADGGHQQRHPAPTPTWQPQHAATPAAAAAATDIRIA